MFGLTNGEGNHGEDVKEYYFYIDSTPTHSYMKMLYKYPQGEFPYSDLVETNRRRGRAEAEYELIDTGVFNEDRYFDVFVEYAKETPTDILIQITVCNRGPDTAPVHVLPTLWFRNVWSLVARNTEAIPSSSHRCERRRGHCGVRRRNRRLSPLLRGEAVAALHRERDQQSADLRHAQRRALCEGRDQRFRRLGQAGSRQSGAGGDQGRGELSNSRWGRDRPQ